MKKILFISIPFMEYIGEIRLEIKMVMEADVDLLYTHRCVNNPGYTLNKLSHGLYEKLYDYDNQRRFFEKVKPDYYDYIFVLVGRKLNVEAFSEFIQNQKKARKILYLWDDVKRVEEFQKIYKKFDKVFAIDKFDCREYGLEFLPLFYCRKYVGNMDEKDIDFSCTGQKYDFRERILNEILRKYPESQYKWYGLLLTSKANQIHERFNSMMTHEKYKKPFYEGTKSLSMSENAEILRRSKVVIDMPNPSQTGLTIRTFESLACRTKMITTNKHIAEYDFYDPQNICIIDSDNIQIPDGFLETEYKAIPESVVEQYSIYSWVKNLFKD